MPPPRKPPSSPFHAPPLPTLWTWLKLAGAMALLAAMLSWLVALFLSRTSDVDFWSVFLWTFSALLFGIPAVFFSWVALSVHLRQKRFQRETYDLGVVRKIAGAEGTVARSGPLTAWFAGPNDRLPMIHEQMQTSRQRFAALVGEKTEPRHPVRIILFARKTEFAAYTKEIGTPLGYLEGVYLLGTPRRLVACSEVECKRPFEPERIVRTLFAYYFLEQFKGFVPEVWLSAGVGNVMAGWGNRGELGRVNRKMLAALARGSDLSADQLFGAKSRVVMHKVQQWQEYENFVYFTQVNFQARSVLEYLCGSGAPERRDRFVAFLKDVGRKDNSEKVFERHFGYGFDRLLEEWRQWVRECGPGTHEPPPPRIKEALLERVIPFVRHPQAEAGEVIFAVRDMANAGYALGANALIGLLRDDDANLRREAAWALETISGIAAGEDVYRWEEWWNSLPSEAEEAP